MNKKKKRLLVDARVLEGEGQGSATYLREMYRAFLEVYNDDFEVFFAGSDRHVILSQLPNLPTVHFIPLPSLSRWKLYGFIFPQLIKKYRIDWAHFQYMVPLVKNCKFMVTNHDVIVLDFPEQFNWYFRLSRKLLFGHAFRKSEIKLTVSEYSQKAISHHFKIDQQAILVTPNAVAPKYFRTYNKEQIRTKLQAVHGLDNYVLFVSRLEKRKNHVLLLSAFERLKLFDNHQLVFVGNNTQDDPILQEMVADFLQRYPGRFRWYQKVEESFLIELYQGAKLFVYPSLAEGFGIPPLEAAACKTPVLCANNTAMTDFQFFKDGLFNPFDEVEFDEKLLERLYREPDCYQLSMIANEVQNIYNWNSAAAVIARALGSTKSSQLPRTKLHIQINSYS